MVNTPIFTNFSLFPVLSLQQEGTTSISVPSYRQDDRTHIVQMQKAITFHNLFEEI
jgi:hypothetical protein